MWYLPIDEYDMWMRRTIYKRRKFLGLEVGVGGWKYMVSLPNF
jgi:hypothetical protein